MCVSYRIREWHCSSVIVQINSHTLKILFNKKTKPFRQSVLHTPDISVKEIISLPLVWCCSYSKNPPLTLFNLHIPAVCSWVKTLWTQNTEILIKSLWIIRKRLFVPRCISHWSDHQTRGDVDLQCLDPESQELMKHNQQMLLFWCSWVNYIYKFYKSDFIYIKKNITCK